ncbi:UvrD-helicase domain-containing protein [Leptolyngbya sp. PCC 6406]|uniref:UvrD-helicase domain-containing protein n=1 Tax=Leptolyngbya sp. PCC 6406 TaxID=1173264 RepID=UPI0002AC54EC|nr:ATP-dependent helicase [Leptolyngbya sp. PCC 6406]
MSITQINAESSVPIEQHFKVSAGPGAGKTRWLVNHIKNILHHSTRLGKTRKIVCITYTNVAIEIILNRLGETAERIEVSTIHSFLYRHVIKPFGSLISDEYGLNIKDIDGHDDHVVSLSKVNDWIKSDYRSLGYLFSDLSLTAYHLENLQWILKNNPQNSLKISVTKRKGQYSQNGRSFSFISDTKQEKLINYKKQYWRAGIIHHDDVLFFSFELIKRYPFILTVLRAKFPYFFVDEFQDTNPIQTKILEQIGQEETIVGIIGDKAQSIYNFQGADPLQLSLFTLEGIAEYQILENYRSTDKIVDFLNCIRLDLQQVKPGQNGNGGNPILIVGEMGASLRKAQELCHGERICSLSRDNITSNVLKKEAGVDCPSEDLLRELVNADSNSDRRKVILSCIKALEFAVEKRYREAIKELSKSLEIGNDKTERKKEALRHLNSILDRYAEIQEMNLMEFYVFVKSNIKDSLANPSRGRPKRVSEK